MDEILIDGSYGEGGGQILRTALSLSSLTGRPVRVEKIRAGRKTPGLQQQHLTCVRAARDATDASVSGDQFSSGTITFCPDAVRGGRFRFDVSEERGSAGSVGLVLQALLPVLVFADKESSVEVRGGTHVAWSPPFHYVETVLLPTLSKMGVAARCELE